ncbi:MAG: hypothetical protein LBJ17_03525 [Dysgonamonadaceae bacterium]|jgi:hypothetical protein|nr:hypothetical protein [Dysgonamonadaceae bacterium]
MKKKFLCGFAALAIVTIATYNVTLSNKTAQVAQLDLKNINMLAIAELTSDESECKSSGGVHSHFSNPIGGGVVNMTSSVEGNIVFGGINIINLKKSKTYAISYTVWACAKLKGYCCMLRGTQITNVNLVN